MPSKIDSSLKYLTFVTIALFVALSLWWISIMWGGTTDAPVNNNFGFLYGGFSIWGGILGLLSAKHWGGTKSMIGRAIITMAFGLLAQAFGQYSFWFHNVYLHIDVPYPGIPDIGFFSGVVFYIYAAFQLARALAVPISPSGLIKNIKIIFIPVGILLAAYIILMHGYVVDLSQPAKIFLDFAYPLGQTMYVGIALITLFYTTGKLGGIMKKPMLLLLGAFTIQFLADYTFIYFQESFYPASFIDYLYLTGYFTMSLGMLSLWRTTIGIKGQKI